ncbi:MAG TPA: ABC transporter permease [Gammaproteobacteria bacterium]|nr:ABC transporter permease [Gammaproteobacteria bacterium]
MTPHKVWLVAQRDYVAYVMRRRFWISLALSPAILLAIMLVPALIQHYSSAHDYAVVDHSGWLLPAVEQRIAGEDYAKLLALAARTPTPARSGLPTVLAAIAPEAAQLDHQGREALAQALAAGTPLPTTPDALAIWRQRAALVRWYAALTPEAAASVDRDLAIARFHRIAPAPDALQAGVEQGSLYAYFILPADALAPGAQFVYASHNLTNTDLRDWFATQVSAVLQARRAAQAGLSPAQAKLISQIVEFDNQLVTKHGARTATSAEQAAQWLPVGYVYLLFLSIMQIAQLLMMSTIEEKSSRIAEMLLAALEPSDIMAGKTLGVACVGVTLVGGWLILILGLLAIFGSMFQLGGFVSAILAAISAWNIAWFLVYFVLGFLLYAAVTGAIGAAVNNIREAQPYMTPVIMFMILPLILMVPVAQDPTALWARVLSYVPPLTPFLMMSRSGEPPPTIDYVATTVLLLATVVVALYLSGRIFQRGLLNTGAPPKFREMLSWARKSKAAAAS